MIWDKWNDTLSCFLFLKVQHGHQTHKDNNQRWSVPHQWQESVQGINRKSQVTFWFNWEKKAQMFLRSLFWPAYLLSPAGVDSVLPEELFKGVLQGGGHHAVHAFQTIRRKQRYEHHAQHHSKYSTALPTSQTTSGIGPNHAKWREGKIKPLIINSKYVVHVFE